MIDFVKILLPSNYCTSLLDHSSLDFYYEFSRHGEIKSVNSKGQMITPKQVAYYSNMRFTVYDSGRITLDGSIHKYWNNGDHNYNDFNLERIRNTFLEFLFTFDIEPVDCRVLSLEYGLNIPPPYPIRLILQNLFYHKGVPFRYTQTHTEGNYYQVKHDQYRIKVYDKSIQYRRRFGLDYDILRTEINYNGIYLRNRFNLTTLEDVFRTPMKVFQDDLITKINEILFYDFTINHKSKRLHNYSNRNYWANLIDNNKTSSLKKHRGHLNDFILDHSENVRQTIIDTLTAKHEELMNKGDSIL